MTHQKILLIYTALFSVCFVLLGISPYDRADWLLENLLAAILVIVLLSTRNKFPLSRVSYTLIFIFLLLHEIGSHYTYANVPYDRLFTRFFNVSLNELMGWQRNHFDRFVHFSYGLLLAYPIREMYCRIANARGFWSYFFPLELTMASSMMYELFEWAAAVFFAGDLGVAYLGTQGDVWDAQKDMGLATLGALLAMLLTLLVNLLIQKNFSKEWQDSLSIKEPRPLGEDAIERLLQEKK